MTNWLSGLRVLEVAGSLDAAVCGRALADAGAEVTVARVEIGQPPDEEPLVRTLLDLPKQAAAHGVDALTGAADVIVLGGQPEAMERQKLTPGHLASLNPTAIVVAITPFGLRGPRAHWRGSDLVTFHAGGLGRILLGPVESPEADPPIRAAGQQSAFVSGLTAALASTVALSGRRRSGAGALIDVSAEEAVATMAARELAMPSFGGVPSRTRTPGQIGLTYVIPAADGHVAISPREPHQWRAWLEVMGNPSWAHEPEMLDRPVRMEHGDRLIAHIAPWSTQHTRAELFTLAQQAHVPCFPVNDPSDVLQQEQFQHRGFFQPAELTAGEAIRVPGPPYRVTVAPPAERGAPPGRTSLSNLPLEGVRVVDLSWVIAGPTCTRFLAAMGAEVIKVESPTRSDPGRGSPLHAVLGQSKRSLALDLKAPGAPEALRRVIAQSDVVVENFAAGVMERFGLGYESLREIRPDLVMLSASGLGRTGPLAGTVAYGTLLQAFTGFSALNTPPGRPPTTGFAWADPLSGTIMATAIAAALDARARTGAGCYIDFSMAEALLWTLPAVIAQAQLPEAAPSPPGNASPRFVPHGLYRAAGEDEWLALAVTDDQAWRALCDLLDVPAPLHGLTEPERRERRTEIDGLLADWVRTRPAAEAAATLQARGVAAAPSTNTQQLFEDEHLQERGFYALVRSPEETLRLPGLPWQWAGVAPRLEAAPEIGSESEAILREVGGLDGGDLAALRAAGALG